MKKSKNIKLYNKKNNYKSIINCKIGKNFKFVEPINIYDCKLGDNVFVGPFVEIGKGVIIKSRTRISSHSFILHIT